MADKMHQLKHKSTPRDSEDSFARQVKGRRHSRSGATKEDKGDASSRGIVIEIPFSCLFELKDTSKKSFSVTHKILDKLEKEARNSQRAPVLVIKFTDTHLENAQWVCIPAKFVKNIVGESVD